MQNLNGGIVAPSLHFLTALHPVPLCTLQVPCAVLHGLAVCAAAPLLSGGQQTRSLLRRS